MALPPESFQAIPFSFERLAAIRSQGVNVKLDTKLKQVTVCWFESVHHDMCKGKGFPSPLVAGRKHCEDMCSVRILGAWQKDTLLAKSSL